MRCLSRKLGGIAGRYRLFRFYLPASTAQNVERRHYCAIIGTGPGGGIMDQQCLQELTRLVRVEIKRAGFPALHSSSFILPGRTVPKDQILVDLEATS